MGARGALMGALQSPLLASPRSRRANVAAVVAVCLFLGMPSLLFPFGRDQAEYACTADAALHGKVIYRDVFCVKPPLTPAVHGLALLAFGRSMASIRILDLL